MWLPVRYSVDDACPSFWQRRTHEWFQPRVTRSEPDKSNCTEKIVSVTFATFECRFFQQRLHDIFFIILISDVYPSVTVYEIVISHSALRMFWMSAWGTTEVVSGRMQPIWVFVALAMVMAVEKCECLTWWIGDTDDQQPVRSPQTSPNWFVVYFFVFCPYAA